MFFYAKSLRILDISNFITNTIYDLEGMFYGCKNLYQVKCKDEKIKKLKNY